MIFEIGAKPQVTFHLMIYELAYIAVPSPNIASDKAFKSTMVALEKAHPKMEKQEVGIQVLESIVCHEEMAEMPKIVRQAVEDMVSYSILKGAADGTFPLKGESVLLRRMYNLGVDQGSNYHWNVFMGDVHDPNEAHLNSVHTNHYLATHNSKNEKKTDGITKMH